ncbi:hypothetical protein AB0I52_21065 [Streptomyces sp. NPDC050423]
MPCDDVLEMLRARQRGPDERIDTLLRSRRTLREFIEATERQASSYAP